MASNEKNEAKAQDKERDEARAQAQAEKEDQMQAQAEKESQDAALEAAGVEKTDGGAPDTSGTVDPFVAFANSALAATGEQVEIPKTPQAIAEQGTELGLAGDFSTGGNLPPVSGSSNDPVYARVWAMDTDHTTGNRHLPDAFKPDCSVRVS